MYFIKKRISFHLLFIFFILKVTDAFNKSWTPSLLFEYTKKNVLSSNNPNNIYNLDYMIIDPENYLSNADFSSINDKLNKLNEELNISAYIILISHLETNPNNDIIKSEVKAFLFYFNYLIKKDYPSYEEDKSIIAAFFIKDGKMRIRVGSIHKTILDDKAALEILNRRNNELLKKDYNKVVNDILDDIYITYKYEIFINNYFWEFFISTLIVFLSAFLLIYYMMLLPEKIRDNKIKEFLRNNKNKQIKNRFNESCIICLENFDEKYDIIKGKEVIQQEKDCISILDCGHRFHEKCLIIWLKKRQKCPVCFNKCKIFE